MVKKIQSASQVASTCHSLLSEQCSQELLTTTNPPMIQHYTMWHEAPNLKIWRKVLMRRWKWSPLGKSKGKSWEQGHCIKFRDYWLHSAFKSGIKGVQTWQEGPEDDVMTWDFVRFHERHFFFSFLSASQSIFCLQHQLLILNWAPLHLLLEQLLKKIFLLLTFL